MTGNFSKQFSKDIMFKILNKYYPTFNITYPQNSDTNTNPAVLSSVLNEKDNTELFVMFFDYDCKFLYDSNFEANAEVFDKLRVEFLAEMVKCFGGNIEYMQGLTSFYNEKLEYGIKILDKYVDRPEIKEMAENEMKQAKAELEFLNSINKTQKQVFEK